MDNIRENGMVQAQVAQKLTLACSLAMSGFLMTADTMPVKEAVTAPVAPYAAPVASTNTDAFITPKDVPEALMLIDKLLASLEKASGVVIASESCRNSLLGHPFGVLSGMLDQAVQSLKPYRGTGELGDGGDLLISKFAEARRKAHYINDLIRQMTVAPKVFESEIRPDGLVALAKHSLKVRKEFSA